MLWVLIWLTADQWHHSFVSSSSSSVSTDGNLYGRLPSLPAEHLWCHPLPALDLGGGHRRRAAGPLHCLCVLLLCKYSRRHQKKPSDKNLCQCTKGTLSLRRQCWRQYQWVLSPQMELYQVVFFTLFYVMSSQQVSVKSALPTVSVSGTFLNSFEVGHLTSAYSPSLPNSLCCNAAPPLL